MDNLADRIEPMIQRIVQKEMEPMKERLLSIEKILESAFNKTRRTKEKILTSENPRTLVGHEVDNSQGSSYKLVFANKLPPVIFTDSKIKAVEDDKPVKIVLIDTISKATVTSNNPLSSMKIEIVVLNGDLGFEDQENWTQQEFNAKVVRKRKQKRPLVIGDLIIALRDGVGIISNLRFTDNSSWMKCRKFRLGARPFMESSGGLERIKEAISDAFVVKDRHGEVCQKQYPPSFNDSVCVLENIRKGGKCHKQLADHEIHTVEDFMRMYTTNPDKLKNILHASSKRKAWDKIVKHASTCMPNDKVSYTYSVEGATLLFDSFYRLKGAMFCGHDSFVDLKDLDFYKQTLAERKTEEAYKNVNDFRKHEGDPLFSKSSPSTSQQDEPIINQTTSQQLPEFPVTSHGSTEMPMDSYPTSTSNSRRGGSEGHNQQLQLAIPQNNHPPPSCFTSAIVNSGMYGSAATSNQVIYPSLASGQLRFDAIAAKSSGPFVHSGARSPVNGCPEPINQTTDQQVPKLPVAPKGSTEMPMDSYPTSTSNSRRGGSEDHNHQLQLAIPQNNHPPPSCFTSAIVNSGMDGSAATSNQITDPSLASSQLRFDAIAAKSSGSFVHSDARSPVNGCIQPEPINQTTDQQVPKLPVAPKGSTRMPMDSYPTSTSNSRRGGSEDHNHQLQLAIPQNNHPLPSCFTSAIVNSGMDGSTGTSNQVIDPSLASGQLRFDAIDAKSSGPFVHSGARSPVNGCIQPEPINQTTDQQVPECPQGSGTTHWDSFSASISDSDGVDWKIITSSYNQGWAT